MMRKKGMWTWFKSFFTNIHVEKVASRLNPDLEVCLIEGKYVLYSSAANYTYNSLDRAFYKLFTNVGLQERNPENVLVLGFGTGSIANTVLPDLKVNPVSVTAVEADEAMISIAETYFNTGRLANLKVIHQDAISFMKGNTSTFNLIISEIYDRCQVPADCESEAFLQDLKRALAPGGMLVFSKIIINKESKKSAKQLTDAFDKVFGKTKIHKVWEFWKTWMITYEHPTNA